MKRGAAARGTRPLPLITLLAVLGTGCAPPIEETRFLNFDAESSAGALGAGWSGFERTPAGDTFAWAQAKSALVAIDSRADGDRLIRFRAWPYRYPGAPPQNVTLFLNDAKIESAVMPDGASVYTFIAPGSALKKGKNQIRVEFTYAEAPKDREAAGDARTLAAAFDWIEVLPPRPADVRKR